MGCGESKANKGDNHGARKVEEALGTANSAPKVPMGASKSTPVLEPPNSPVAAPSRGSDRSLRVLCLHGYGSNNDISNMQLAGLRIPELAWCQCDLLHGPFDAGSPYMGLGNFSNGPWYMWSGRTSLGLQWDSDQFGQSLGMVLKFIDKYGPYDGVYGFSQGCAVISTLSRPTVWRDKFGLEACPWRFAMMACGGASGLVAGEEGAGEIQLASFHFKGARDWILSQSTELEEMFSPDERVSYTAQVGHEVPMNVCHTEPGLRPLLNDFLEKQLLVKYRAEHGERVGDSMHDGAIREAKEQAKVEKTFNKPRMIN